MTDDLDRLEAHLEQHLAYIRESAKDAARWVLASRFYGLSHTAPPAGPAPVDQVRSALRTLSMLAASELERLAGDAERIQALWDRLACLVATESERYAESLHPPGGGLGLGAIFQNATASVGKHPWSGRRYDLRITLLCKGCGAPQERTRDFRCAYCGADLFRRPSDVADATATEVDA